MAKPKIHPLGDAALLVELGQRIDTALNSRAIAMAAALRTRKGVREVVPGYTTVTVHYDPERATFKGLARSVEQLAEHRPPPAPPGRLHRIPVVYDGPDLEETAQALGLGIAELIELHTGPTYRCFMIGFTPGWAYLGPLPERLRLPRRHVPRTSVPTGSVAIGGAQTGVYPLPTPGGWHLIGRTPVPMFVPDATPPCLLRTGDRVRFFLARSGVAAPEPVEEPA